MPADYLYINQDDAKQLFEILNADPEIAFLVVENQGHEMPEGPNYQYCKAYPTLEPSSSNQDYVIWHMPSGPVLRDYYDHEDDSKHSGYAGINDSPLAVIEDPFKGWVALKAADAHIPYTHNKPQFFDLQVCFSDVRFPDLLPPSSFSWIGSYFEQAPESAKKYWQKIKRMIKKGAKPVYGDGKTMHKDSKVYCWPHAYQFFQQNCPQLIV